MGAFRRWLRHAAGCTAWITAAAVVQPAAAAPQDFVATGPSADATRLVDWVLHSRDARGKPFAVVDKHQALIYVFHGDGRLAGHSRALLGSALGDHSAPDVGANAQTGHVPPEQRTTPAGRFEAAPGANDKGEHVIWVDYDSAFAIHRLRPGFAYDTRASRLANARADGKRVSWGCVVVPVAFYRAVVEQVLGRSPSVVYVMPETRGLQSLMRIL